jgi:hypothetical protein
VLLIANGHLPGDSYVFSIQAAAIDANSPTLTPAEPHRAIFRLP